MSHLRRASVPAAMVRAVGGGAGGGGRQGLSFRRFAGIPLAEAVPDHGSIWRFREHLARRGLPEHLLAEIDRQPDGKVLILRRSTLIDTTILDAAVRPPG